MIIFRIDANTNFTFADARDAIDAISAYEADTPLFLAYSIKPVFGGGERVVVGYQARVSDLDGFSLGTLAPAA